MPKEETSERGWFAKLIRGNSYTIRNKKFERGVETPVTEDLAKELEELTSVRKDRDGETVEKARFKVYQKDTEADDDDGDDDEDAPKAKRTKIKRPSRKSLRS